MIATEALRIEHATDADVPAVVAMGLRFIRESSYRGMRENPEQIATFTRWVIAHPDAVLFVQRAGDQVVGMLALLLTTHYFSGDPIVNEIVWWVEPEHRGSGRLLLAAGELWALERGAKAIQMIAPHPAIGRWYERLGYVKVECAYQKTW